MPALFLNLVLLVLLENAHFFSYNGYLPFVYFVRLSELTADYHHHHTQISSKRSRRQENNMPLTDAVAIILSGASMLPLHTV